MRALLGTPGLKVGTYIGEFATPGIGAILATSGCDYAFVDMEHSGFGFETANQILRNLHGAGLGSLLRVPSHARHHLQRAADIGAQGIILPMVETPAQVQEAVAALKFPPEGKRGVILGVAHDDFARAPITQAFSEANQKICLVALLETAQALENCEAICAVEGLDAIWIGHLDLSSSLGIPGAFGDPKFKAAIKSAKHDAAIKAGIPVGQLVDDPAAAAECYATGSALICYSGDMWLLRKALSDGIADIRRRIAANP